MQYNALLIYRLLQVLMDHNAKLYLLTRKGLTGF